MKSLIFSTAIGRRKKVRFLYDLEEIILEPYFISRNKIGKKVIFGRLNNSNVIKMFEYNQICNIKILESSKFSPIIPIAPIFN